MNDALHEAAQTPVGPAPSSKPVNLLRRALRDEMFAVLNQGELTPAMCSTLMRLAESSREILRAGTMKPEDFTDTTDHNGDQEVQPPNVETFGVKMLKELMPVLQAKFNPKPVADTAKLVEALAVARKEGLKDVEADLMVQLGLVRPEPGEGRVVVPTGGPVAPPIVGTARPVGVDVEVDLTQHVCRFCREGFTTEHKAKLTPNGDFFHATCFEELARESGLPEGVP